MKGRITVPGNNQRRLSEHLRDNGTSKPHYPLGYAWASRRAMGRKLHVVTHTSTGWVLLCTGGRATMEHRKGFLTAINCRGCRSQALVTAINYPEENRHG